ncbi:thioesterase domain-containing protein [Streptomyces sp. NPDC019531]|uniref:thioesterase domain-containing protein n=1 Tax=Streptomyces sp. NPDC019531 TaxID=3365062 RepID=UPI00384CC31A
MESIAPRSDIEQKLIEIWTQLLGHTAFGVHDSFFHVGGDSFSAVRLLPQLNSRFGCDISLAELVRNPTVSGIAAILGGSVTEATVLVPLNPQGRRPPLFCIHPVSGNVSRFFELARTLGEEQPVYAFQSAGLSDGLLAQDSIEQMAATYVEKIVRLRPRGPYRLLGYSMGGIVAYECARRLYERTGEHPFVAMVDTDLRDLSAIDPWDLLVRTVLKANVKGTALRGLERDAAVSTLHGLCVGHGVFDADFPLARLGDIYDTVLANIMAMRTYTPTAYSGGITLFCCGQTSDLGWSPHAGSITNHVLGADHYKAMEREGSSRIAAVLSQLPPGDGEEPCR